MDFKSINGSHRELELTQDLQIETKEHENPITIETTCLTQHFNTLWHDTENLEAQTGPYLLPL